MGQGWLEWGEVAPATPGKHLAGCNSSATPLLVQASTLLTAPGGGSHGRGMRVASLVEPGWPQAGLRPASDEHEEAEDDDHPHGQQRHVLEVGQVAQELQRQAEAGKQEGRWLGRWAGRLEGMRAAVASSKRKETSGAPK